MLTKSDFVKFIQCPKFLWLYKHRKDLLPEEVDKNLQRIFDEGYEVETYAYKLFPEGVSAQLNGFKESISRTKELMEEKTPVVFQPTVSGEELFCRADIIKLNEDGESWDIYEVKSATAVKDINIHDLSFQKICFEDCGFKIRKIHIIFLNNQYVRQGEIEPEKLFKIEDITEQVEYITEQVEPEIEQALNITKGKDEPDIRILKQCNTPYECTFLDYCWENIPKNSIYSIAGGLTEAKLNMLLDEGVLEIKDIPEGIVTSTAGLRHYHAEKHNKIHIELENIKEEIEQLEYPLYFLDYETFAPGIPLFDGYRPWQRMVFQYSLHIQEKPGGEIRHHAYLAKDWEDPSSGLAADLKKRIGSKGSVVVWCAWFEKGCNTEMGQRYPEYTSFFGDLNERAFDLMQIFKKGYYVHKDFHGSASLKKVLPVLIPGLSYQDLNIQEGMTASNSWRDMIDEKTDKDIKEKIYNDLLKYCALDTLAMVDILAKVRDIIKK